MSRRFTSAETTGMTVLLLCIVVPVLLHFLLGGGEGPAADDAARRDSIRQARIDSAQRRSDSILEVRTAARARRDSLRRHRRDSIRAARAFRPDTRDRLNDVVSH